MSMRMSILPTTDEMRMNGTQQLDWTDVNFEGKVISPLLFSILIEVINVEDSNYGKILTRSCSHLKTETFPTMDDYLLSDGLNSTTK